jgi:hypothetical protein
MTLRRRKSPAPLRRKKGARLRTDQWRAFSDVPHRRPTRVHHCKHSIIAQSAVGRDNFTFHGE